MSSKKTMLKVENREVAVSNLDKVFYPEAGFTKGQVIDYYIRIAPVMLPHLKGRPLSMKRYPDGVNGMFFYEKQCPSHAPSWIKTRKVAKSDGGHIDYCVINDLPSLVWAANIANLEFHTFQHVGAALQRPTALVFDLDPGPPANILQCCRVALRMKDMFEAVGLQAFPKTSGSKGMQLMVPLNTPVNYDKTKAFARRVADILSRDMPDLVVADMKKSLRKGKVFIDWSQNDDKKTTVCVYSLRAKETPNVSTPLHGWEVTAAGRPGTGGGKKGGALVFQTAEVLKRVQKWGDLYEPVLTMKQKLPSPDKLEA
jgi:bifunctional non-homologous end joining protein LigD